MSYVWAIITFAIFSIGFGFCTYTLTKGLCKIGSFLIGKIRIKRAFRIVSNRQLFWWRFKMKAHDFIIFRIIRKKMYEKRRKAYELRHSDVSFVEDVEDFFNYEMEKHRY